MLDYRIRLRLLAPAGTPWQSDTLFGHLVCLVAWGRCDLSVDAFLAPFRAGEPPLIFSDGFPAGLMPRPMLPAPPPSPGQRRSPSDYAADKRRRKARWVDAALFQRLRRGEPLPPDAPVPDDPWRTITTLHAALDRRSLRTGGEGSAGQLFETEALALDPPLLDLYLRAADEAWGQRAAALLVELSRSGYGRDKSVGLGAFRVEAVEPCADLAPPPGADGFIALSSYVPAPGDPVDGRWRVRVKRGKLGEPVAPDPFKRPLLELEPGAVFRCADGPPRPWYGRLVEGVAPARPEALQCGLTLAVACRWPPDR